MHNQYGTRKKCYLSGCSLLCNNSVKIFYYNLLNKKVDEHGVLSHVSNVNRAKLSIA